MHSQYSTIERAVAGPFSHMRPDPISSSNLDSGLGLMPFLGLLLILHPVVVWGQHAAAEPAAASPAVQKLLDQLQSDEWRVRQEAVDKLVAVGEEALPHLQTLVSTTTDGEVRSRAASAIARIGDQRRVGATMVTLKLDAVPPAAAFEGLFRQAQAPLLTDPANLLASIKDKRVSLDAAGRPFWEVMQSLCAQAGVEPATIERRTGRGRRQQERADGLGLVAAGANRSPAAKSQAWDDKPLTLAGPILVRLDRLTLVSNVRLRDPAGAVSREFHVSLTAFAEPKLKVLDYSSVVRLDEVVDDNGNSLIPRDDQGIPANAEVYGNARPGHPGHWEAGATLHYPTENRGRRIARLKASIAFEIQIRSGVLDLPLGDGGRAQASGMEQTVGGVRMLVKGFDPAAPRLDVTVYRDGRDDAQWYRVRTLLSAGEGRILDGAGQTISRTPVGPSAEESEDSQRLEVRVPFERTSAGAADAKVDNAAGPEAARVVWEFPAETRQVVVPFEFNDLPMP